MTSSRASVAWVWMLNPRLYCLFLTIISTGPLPALSSWHYLLPRSEALTQFSPWCLIFHLSLIPSQPSEPGLPYLFQKVFLDCYYPHVFPQPWVAHLPTLLLAATRPAMEKGKVVVVVAWKGQWFGVGQIELSELIHPQAVRFGQATEAPWASVSLSIKWVVITLTSWGLDVLRIKLKEMKCVKHQQGVRGLSSIRGFLSQLLYWPWVTGAARINLPTS